MLTHDFIVVMFIAAGFVLFGLALAGSIWYSSRGSDKSS